MCESMLDIQSATAEITWGKRRKNRPEDENIMSTSAMQGGHRPQEEHPACKNWVMRYLSAARCNVFAYGPADVTATPSPLASLNPDWFNHLVPAYPDYPAKEAVKWVSVCLSACLSSVCLSDCTNQPVLAGTPS